MIVLNYVCVYVIQTEKKRCVFVRSENNFYEAFHCKVGLKHIAMRMDRKKNRHENE